MRAVIFDIDHTIFTAENTVHDGLEELLAILRRLGVGVGALSANDHRALVRLDEAGLLPYFDNVLCADQAYEPKAVAGVHHMLQLLGAEPHEGVLVSHAHADILLGKDAQLGRTIGVTHGHDSNGPLRGAGADRIVHNLPAVLDVLE